MYDHIQTHPLTETSNPAVLPNNESIIFLIVDDNDSRPLFRKRLKSAGYKVILALDEEDALERVADSNLKAALLLINLPYKSPEETLSIGRNICLNGKLSIPIVVIATKYEEDLEGKNVQITGKEFITYPDGGEHLDILISNLIQ